MRRLAQTAYWQLIAGRRPPDCAGLKLLDAKTIIVVAADQGLRWSVAFALEVEGYSTESYETVQKA
ncbi:transcriptional regulator [Sinorhizobium medicae]|nr:transcriptional regulator [Sinorhizobium medicae]